MSRHPAQRARIGTIRLAVPVAIGVFIGTRLGQRTKPPQQSDPCHAKPSPPADPSLTGNRETIDQAALMGAGLAATVTLVLGEGAYSLFSTIVGVSLIVVLIGYYRPVWEPQKRWRHTLRRAVAHGAVTGLCASVTMAYPLQQWLEETPGACSLVPPPERAECLAEAITTDWIAVTWLVSGQAVTLVYIGCWVQVLSSEGN